MVLRPKGTSHNDAPLHSAPRTDHVALRAFAPHLLHDSTIAFPQHSSKARGDQHALLSCHTKVIKVIKVADKTGFPGGTRFPSSCVYLVIAVEFITQISLSPPLLHFHAGGAGRSVSEKFDMQQEHLSVPGAVLLTSRNPRRQ